MLFSTIEPILNPLWVVLLIGETPGLGALLGGALVLASITGRGLMLALGSGLGGCWARTMGAERPAEGV